MIVVVAEKPSVAREIARVLGCKAKAEGYLFSDTHQVTWALGHLLTLKDPDEYDERLKRWSLETLPILPTKLEIKPIRKTQKQLTVIKRLINAKDCEHVICATDAGREGELIFRYIYEYAKCKKPASRLWISSLTDTAISEGFKNLKSLSDYDNLYASARCRAEADWLVGMNATRAYTIRHKQLLSLGRVQTPTLALIVARHFEIERFVPEVYYEVTTDYEDFSGKYFTLTDEGKRNTRIQDEQTARAIARQVKGQTGVVTSVTEEPKRKAPPLLYDLTELQRDANKLFGLSAAKTLEIAQSLYERHKLITYPRTDSRYLPDDMYPKLTAVIKGLSVIGDAAPFSAEILAKPSLPKTSRVFNSARVSDHHAIIPTDKLAAVKRLSPDEAKVFELIWRRFLSVFLSDYQYISTDVVIKACEHLFYSKGQRVTDAGWTRIYPSYGKDEEDSGDLPQLVMGQAIEIVNAHAKKQTTKPPKPYTEATLLSAMENAGKTIEDENLREAMKDSGLGTPATRAAIIERLIQVEYIKRRQKSLIPTEKALFLIPLIPHELASAETTGKWEKGLSSIAVGRMKEDRFRQSIERFVKYLVESVRN